VLVLSQCRGCFSSVSVEGASPQSLQRIPLLCFSSVTSEGAPSITPGCTSSLPQGLLSSPSGAPSLPQVLLSLKDSSPLPQ
ncbi:hypothetical protein NDU88_007832, partial [Pleurodeles waltl]